MADSMFQPKRRKTIQTNGTTTEYDAETGRFISGKALRNKYRHAAKNRARLVEPAPEPKPAMSKEDRASVDKHYRANYDKLVKRVTPACGSQALAEDVVQEAYTQACEYMHDDVENFEPWFWGILKNTVRKAQKEEIMKGATTVSLDDVKADEETWLRQQFPAAQEQRYELTEIKRTVDCYKPATAAVLRMALFGQMSYQDIADRTGKSYKAVEFTVNHFRKKLAAR